MKKRHAQIEELIFKFLMKLSLGFIVVVLSLILFSIFYRGVPALNWEMITQTPRGGYYFGKEGGVANAILGSLYLTTGATLLAFIVGLPIAMLLNIHLVKYRRFTTSVRFLLDLMWGVPSIVYGAFGFSVMVWMGVRTSLLAGMITVALFILPILVRAIDEVLQNVPQGLREASASLGANRSQTAFIVYFRQCASAIVTGIMVALGRGIGDAASVLFTTGYTDNIPTSLTQPAATLPLSIFFQLSSPIAEVRDRAYASAAILTIIILIISISARLLSGKYNKHKIF